MKRLISDQFGELWEQTANERRVPIGDLPALHNRAVAIATKFGLEYIREDRELPRQKLYALCPRGSELTAAVDLVAAMAERHGPGRWWSTGGAVGYIEDGEGGARVADINGEPHVWLRMYYFHDPVVPQ